MKHQMINELSNSKFGMCFSKDFEGNTPLSHIGKKLPVYLRLLELCQKQGWEVYVLTRKTYIGNSEFNGAWLFKNGKFERVEKIIRIDLVFDWVGNLLFPPKSDTSLTVVNSRKFKELSCDKWKMYEELKDYMPKTYWVGEIKNAIKLVDKIGTDMVVLKPFDGLRGKGIFIGTKEKLKDFKLAHEKKKYILQEFIDTSHGIKNITPGKHDLRVVIVNGEAVWCHVRVPTEGSFLANAAQGGNLTEVDYSRVPESVKKIVETVSKKFYKKYNNPIFSIDFGIDEKGTPKIFEINDQIGFPRWEMKNRDVFLNALVSNFSSKIFDLDIILFTHGPGAYAPRRLVEEAKKSGITLRIIKYKDINIIYTSNGLELKLGNKKMPVAHGVFLRGLGEDSIYNPIRTAIITWFKSKGSKLLNEESFSKWPSLDKTTQYINLASHNIPVVESFSFSSIESLKKWSSKSYPFIAKDIIGSNGIGVYKISDKSDLSKHLDKYKSNLKIKTLLFQRFLPDARDLRVIILGGKIVGAMRRIAQQGNFLSNYSQGGRVESYEIREDSEATNTALNTAKLFKLDYGGIDLMKNNKNEWVVLEVNRACQFEGFESATGINVASRIVDYLAN